MTATLATVPVAPMTFAQAVAEARAVSRYLAAQFAERDEEVRMAMVALVAGTHVLLLGPPGTAKSQLVNAFTRCLADATRFEYLLTRFTVDSELFGPVSLKGLENDEYRRIVAGYLPSCDVAFLDEIFKANSAILNALLTLLNERAFDNNGRRMPVPLEIAFGASNELPEDESLDALYDRFVVRRWVHPIKDDDKAEAVYFRGHRGTVEAKAAPEVLSRAALAVLRGLAEQVTVPAAVRRGMMDIKTYLATKHSITASDRRWCSIAELICASAALDGRNVATMADLTVMVDALWRTPDERATIRGIVSEVSAPQLAAALRIEDAAREAFERGKAAFDESGPSAADKITRLNATLAKMTDAIRASDPAGTNADVQVIAERVAALQQQTARAAAKALKLKF